MRQPPAAAETYSIRMPEMALAMTNCWIAEEQADLDALRVERRALKRQLSDAVRGRQRAESALERERNRTERLQDELEGALEQLRRSESQVEQLRSKVQELLAKTRRHLRRRRLRRHSVGSNGEPSSEIAADTGTDGLGGLPHRTLGTPCIGDVVRRLRFRPSRCASLTCRSTREGGAPWEAKHRQRTSGDCPIAAAPSRRSMVCR